MEPRAHHQEIAKSNFRSLGVGVRDDFHSLPKREKTKTLILEREEGGWRIFYVHKLARVSLYNIYIVKPKSPSSVPH